MSLPIEKSRQACEILAELGLDCWLIWVRETMQQRDPSFDLVVGMDVISPTALIYTRDGDRIAIAQDADARGFPEGAFTRVVPYVGAYEQLVRDEFARLDPQVIAINTSTENVAADGLTSGMRDRLQAMLTGTPHVDRLIPADPLVLRLRGRKLPEEVDRIRHAVRITERIFDELRETVRVGQSEREIAEFVHARMRELGVESAWDAAFCPAVDAGPDKEFGHAGPAEHRTRTGHLLHFDFGVKANGYCADLQRMYFFGSSDEIPGEVRHAFDTVRAAIDAAAAFLRPGRIGHEVDAVARAVVTDAGYEEYGHGTGHPVGRFAHDGGMRLAPMWEIFGDRAFGTVEEGNVFTLELNVRTPSYGQVSLEENVLVTSGGAQLLSTPQTDFFYITD